MILFISIIKSQGLVGRLATVNINKVVKTFLVKAKKRRTIYIPGFVNILMVRSSLLMPGKLFD